MADNFHTLDEAAKLLNVTPEQLGEMRDNGEIRGFRDGSTWKFKTSEVQKLIDQSSAGSDSSELGFEDEGDDEVTMLGESPDLAACWIPSMTTMTPSPVQNWGLPRAYWSTTPVPVPA